MGLENCAEELEEGRTKYHLIRKVSVSIPLQDGILRVGYTHRSSAQDTGKCGQMKTPYMPAAVKITRDHCHLPQL